MATGTDEHQPEGQGLAHVLLPGDDVAVEEAADLEGRQGEGPGGQGVGRGISGQAETKNEQRGAEDGGHEHRDPDVAPVLPGVGTEVLRRLVPGRLQPLEGGQGHQDHEGDLEVHVDQGYPGERIEVEARARMDAQVVHPVASPIVRRPRELAMNMKASGMPPKLANTPEAVTHDPAQDRTPGGVDGISQERPGDPGTTEVTRAILSEFLKPSR